MTEPTHAINLWNKNGQLLRSRRLDSKLVVDSLGPVEYVAFCRSGNESKIIEASSDRADFPGWSRLTFQDYDTRKLSLERHSSLLFEADVSPVRRYLADNECVLDAPLRAYTDIETDSRIAPRVQAEFAPGRILSWALADDGEGRWVETLAEDSDDAEAELLASYWRRMSEYDQIAAWFGDDFDFPVIDIRSKMLARKFPKRFAHFWEHCRRLLFVDQAACFKRHHMAPESGDDKTSMKLNAVCQAILGEGKHDFNARRTWESWFEGGAERARMAAYNLQDTVLLPKLEAATGYLELQQTLAAAMWTPANSHGLKPTPQVDGYMLRGAHLRKTHLPSKKPPTGAEKQYEGAYVMPPTGLGIHEMVHVCDFKSLYPTVIRSLNVGAEMKDLIGCTAFGTGVSFGQEEESILASAVRTLMEQRDFWKKKAKADPNDKYAGRMNKTFKIACNAIYGVMGSPWSRFYDVEIAESITLGAKALIMATITEAKKRGWNCIYGDTDSLFVTGCTVEQFKEFVAWCNKNLYPKMLSDAGCNPAFNCIELDYEKCYKMLVFPLANTGVPACKRYFAAYDHYAFKPKAGADICGLEYMRGDGIQFARHNQKECIERILAGQSALELEEWVVALRQRVMTEKLPIEDIVISKGIGQELEAYAKPGSHIKLAMAQAAAGEDIGQGSKIEYVISNGDVSPMEIIAAEDYVGEFDRYNAWNKQTYPCILRVLAGAFPTSRNWKRWIARRPRPVGKGQMSLGLT